MDGRSHDWSSAKRIPRRQVPLTEFYLGQPPNPLEVTQTHDRTLQNTTNTSDPHSRALPNVTEHIPHVTNFSQGVQTQPSRQTDRLTYLNPRPYGYRRGRGLEGEALPRYRWERLSLSRTQTKTTIDLRTYDSDGRPTRPGQRAGLDDTLCTHDDQLGKIYVYTEFQKRLCELRCIDQMAGPLRP